MNWFYLLPVGYLLVGFLTATVFALPGDANEGDLVRSVGLWPILWFITLMLWIALAADWVAGKLRR